MDILDIQAETALNVQHIEITGCELIYELDSKGYLQPDYEFSCMINGRENKIIIPVLK